MASKLPKLLLSLIGLILVGIVAFFAFLSYFRGKDFYIGQIAIAWRKVEDKKLLDWSQPKIIEESRTSRGLYNYDLAGKVTSLDRSAKTIGLDIGSNLLISGEIDNEKNLSTILFTKDIFGKTLMVWRLKDINRVFGEIKTGDLIFVEGYSVQALGNSDLESDREVDTLASEARPGLRIFINVLMTKGSLVK